MELLGLKLQRFKYCKIHKLGRSLEQYTAAVSFWEVLQDLGGSNTGVYNESWDGTALD